MKKETKEHIVVIIIVLSVVILVGLWVAVQLGSDIQPLIAKCSNYTNPTYPHASFIWYNSTHSCVVFDSNANIGVLP